MNKDRVGVLRAVHHGSHVVDDSKAGAELARSRYDVTTSDEAGGRPTVEAMKTTTFDYLFDELVDDASAHLPADDPAKVVAALKELGRLMVEAQPQGPPAPGGDSTIPAIYTYWGQFVDHDITLNTDGDIPDLSDITNNDVHPMPPAMIVEKLQNGRVPFLNLDSVYGDGPALSGTSGPTSPDLYDGINLKIGQLSPLPFGELIPPTDDMDRDLPRRPDKSAIIGDPRNDENLVVAQLHLAFLRFHNETVKRLKADPDHQGDDDATIFARAKELVQWHYQWLVVNDFLETVCAPGVVDQVLLGGNKVFEKRTDPTYMPLEFSVAAFRFGHTMVRDGYDWNRNFGTPVTQPTPDSNQPFASLVDLFRFTGSGGMRGAPTLPANWPAEWDRMVDKGSSDPGRFTRKVDTLIAFDLSTMLNQGNKPDEAPFSALLKHLAQRNLLRAYVLSIPTGQAAAKELGVKELSADELRQGNGAELNGVLESGGFLERTPLWYYVLKEAEVRSNGNALGPVGSHIVAETLIGQLRLDPESYLNHTDGWSPAVGMKLASGDLIVTIGDFFRFAGVMA